MAEEVTDILLVEDTADDAKFFSIALKEWNPNVSLCVAMDGAEALALMFGEKPAADTVPKLRPRIVVLDIKLPRISGLELARWLKQNPHTQAIPIIALSSSKEKRDIVDCYHVGVNSYLVKPMDFDEFAGLVEALGDYWLQRNISPKA